jgi:hypothetical protein
LEYQQQFERDFMRRTLSLVKPYQGPHDATLLLNCLLGLPIVPKEASIEKIPADPVSDLQKWGISPRAIKSYGNRREPKPDTLRGIVWSLRNAVAHFNFEPLHKGRVVTGFSFSDRSGFAASIDISEMREFVERLAKHLDAQYVG